jgi:predicted nicotinamide N-methyase
MPGDLNLGAIRNRLLWRIQRRYVTTTSEVRLGPLRFPFTRIADPDRVLDQVAREADRRERLTGRREQDEQLHLPYWAELWDSAMGMAQVMVRRREEETMRQGDKEINAHEGIVVQASEPALLPPLPSGEGGGEGESRETPIKNAPPVSLSPCLPVSLSSSNVLDLGCGMGLSGTVAAALGANVLFADIEPPALLFARLNSLPWRRRARARRVNWKTDLLPEKFNLILGADIVYERSQWEFLEPFWRAHLNSNGTIMLGEPGRQTGDHFVEWIRKRGWTLDVLEEKVTTRERAIRVMILRPK